MADFSIKASDFPMGYVVAVAGRAGGPESEHMEEELNRLVSMKPSIIVLDLSSLEYLSSMGVSALIRLNRSMKEAGGSVRLAAVPDSIMALLRAVRLDHLCPVFSTVAEATR